jgi:probable selenium-dependent hydroxylase accessory protein YqeC
MMTLSQAMGIEEKSVVTFVGAGGKTTSMYKTAHELSDRGLAVLITTTTKIYSPGYEGRDNLNLILGSPQVLCEKFKKVDRGIVVAAACELPNSEKLAGYTPDEIDLIHSRKIFDVILVEADGAKEKPVKAPAAHEPVIPKSANFCIGVVGLDCLDKPLNEQIAHRAESLAALSGQGMNSIIHEETIKSLVLSPAGLFKSVWGDCFRILMLNKADTPELKRRGEGIINSLIRLGSGEAVPNQALICSGLNNQYQPRFIKSFHITSFP